jgi:hypothetical protein
MGLVLVCLRRDRESNGLAARVMFSLMVHPFAAKAGVILLQRACVRSYQLIF